MKEVTIEHSYNTGNVLVMGDKNQIGGIAGVNASEGASTIKNCYNTGYITGTGTGHLTGTGEGVEIGGIAGVNMSGTTIQYCCNTGYVSKIGIENEKDRLGSIVGSNSGTITTSFYLEKTVEKGVGNNETREGYPKSAEELATSMKTAGFNTYPWITVSEGGASPQQDNLFLNMPQLQWAEDKEAPKVIVSLKTEEGNPDTYLISNKEELEFLRNQVNVGFSYQDKTVRLMNDIDLGSIPNWVPIGNYASSFEGKFDGNNKTIRNLKIECYYIKDVGLFGKILGPHSMPNNKCKIMNLHVTNASVKGYVAPAGHPCNTGGIVGYTDYATIEGCSYGGCVFGEGAWTGGITGISFGGSIQNCHNTGNVSGTGDNASIGGISGENATILNCYNTGEVSGKSDSPKYWAKIGGIAGSTAGKASTIRNCYNTGSISGNNASIGGIAGKNESGHPLENCYNTGSVSGNNASIGGIAGDVSIFLDLKNNHFLNGVITVQDIRSESINVTAFIEAMKKDFIPENGWKGTVAFKENKLYLPSFEENNPVEVLHKFFKLTVDVKVDGDASSADWKKFTGHVTPEDSFYIKGATLSPMKAKADIDKANTKDELFGNAVYQFKEWTGFPADGKMPANNLTVTAQFNKYHKLNLEFVLSEDGSTKTKTIKVGDPLYNVLKALVTVSPNKQEKLIKGNVITLSAKTNDDYEFLGWDDKGAKGDKEITIDKADVTQQIYFKELIKRVTYKKATNLVYNGKPQQGITEVSINGQVQDAATYTITYQNNVNAGTATAVLKFNDPKIDAKVVFENEDQKRTTQFSIAKAELTVTPDAGQQVYAGADDYQFSYTVAGEVNGEKAVFTGALGRGDGKITRGTLAMVNGKGENKFLAANYELKVDESISFIRHSKDIDEVLEEAVNRVTREGKKGKSDWFVSDKVIIKAPEGFEILYKGKNYGKQLEYTEQGRNMLIYQLVRTGGNYPSQSFGLEVNIDSEKPIVELEDVESLKAIFELSDNASGILYYQVQPTAQESQSAKQLLSGSPSTKGAHTTYTSFQWRGKEGKNIITVKVSDLAGNELEKEFIIDLTYTEWGVTLPSVPFATTVPKAGTYQVEEGEPFSFEVKPTAPVKAEDLDISLSNGQYIKVRNGKYYIKGVWEDIKVNIEEVDPVANEDIAITAFRVRTANSSILIETPETTDVAIFDFNGRLLRSVKAAQGTTRISGLPQGAYIVKSALGTVKIKL